MAPITNDVVLDARDVALDSHIGENEDFETQGAEKETAGDRAIAALEGAR
jgi:hypothetical protein